MEYVIRVLLVFVVLGSSLASANQLCVGYVSKVYVESDGSLYYNVRDENSCTCNFADGFGMGFMAPVAQKNTEAQYAMLMAAFLAKKKVTVWHDWTAAVVNQQRCLSHNIALSE